MHAHAVRVAIERSFPELLRCTPAPQSARCACAPPLVYPDGGVIDVFVVADGASHTVTDRAEALGWLRMRSGHAPLSCAHRRLVEDTCQTLGLTFDRGALALRCEGALTAEAVLRVAQGAARVADLWLAARARRLE